MTPSSVAFRCRAWVRTAACPALCWPCSCSKGTSSRPSRYSRPPSGSYIDTARAVAISRMSVSGCRSLKLRPPLAAVANGSNVSRAAHAAGSCMGAPASDAGAATACATTLNTSLRSQELRHGRSKSVSASVTRAGSTIRFQRSRRTCAGRPTSGLRTNIIGSTTPGRWAYFSVGGVKSSQNV
jgi:hypothetical protein